MPNAFTCGRRAFDVRVRHDADRGHNVVVRFADLVAVTDRVRALSVRQDKVTEICASLIGRSPSDAMTITDLLLRVPLFELPDNDTGTAPDDREPSDPPRRDRPDADRPAAAPAERASLTCEQVTAALDQIDRTEVASLRRTLVVRLLEQATADEQRWIRAATATDDPDRPTFGLVVSSVARTTQVPVRELRRAATLCGSLPLATRIAFERSEAGLRSVTIEPGRPVSPTVPEIHETASVLIDPPWPAVLEWNLRAERIQVHRRRGEVMVFDGHLRDVTEAVPTIVEQVAALPRGDLVLDGWADLDPGAHSGSRVTASWTSRTRTGMSAGGALFFDVLYDGAPVVDDPLSVRRELLASIVPESSIVPSLAFDDLDAIAATLNEGVSLGHDGFILKSLGDPYEGGFVKSSWRLVRGGPAVRLAVTAVERGSGDRSHLLTTVHLAAPDEHGRLHPVTKTTRGLTADRIVWQTGVFAELVLDDDEPGDVFNLRPEVTAFVTIDGVDDDGPDPSGVRLHRPRILGYERDGETLTSLRSLRELAHRPDDGHRAPSLPTLPAVLPTVAAPPPAADPGRPSDRATSNIPVLPPREASLPAVAGVNFEPYHEPKLASSRGPVRAVVAARMAALLWVLALLAAGLRERSTTDAVDGSLVVTVGWAGLVVAALLSISGWVWSDQLVRNAIRLDGRKPSRLRCLSAWTIPPIAVAILSFGVVPLEPTEPVDVRPAIIVAVFALAMWRPYSLIRRILATLTQLRSDVLVASAYLVDALGLGLVWWRLTLWQQRADDLSPDDVDVLVGTLAAVSVAMLLGLGVWLGLLESCRRALEHRRTSQRTRYEHRMLRLSGVDPGDPEVWWELVQRRAEDQRALEPGPHPSGEPVAPRALPTVEELLEQTRREHRLAFRRLGAEESERLESRLREEFTAIVGETTGPTARTAPHGPPGPDAPERDDERVHLARRSTADVDEVDPIDVLRRTSRTLRGRTVEPSKPVTGEIELLIDRAGSLEIEAALLEHRRALREELDHDLVPPTLYLIEAARLVMVVTFAALAIVNGWLVVNAVSADVIAETGALGADAVSDLDVARRWFWHLLTAGSAFVPIWAFVIVRKARQAGVEVARPRRIAVLAVLASAACIAGFLLDGDERGTVTLALSAVIVWSAVSAGFGLEPVRSWYGLPAWTLTSWTATLPVILALAWLAGLTAPIEPTVSLQRLTFTTILLAFGCARVTVISFLSSVDLEDKLRTSPELAVPARRRRRRR